MKKLFTFIFAVTMLTSVLMLAGTTSAKAQTGTVTIKGTVKDAAGLGIPSVNVMIKGTAIGTQTDEDGNYIIVCPVGSTLVYSYIGFITVEKVVLMNGGNIIDVILLEES